MRLPRFFLLPLSAALWLAAFGASWAAPSRAEDRLKVWVTLRDKGAAASGLSGRAFEDAPVQASCLERLRNAGLEIAVVLRWQNRVSGWVDAAGVGTVAGLPCVRRVEELPRKVSIAAPVPVPGAPLSLLAKAGADSAGFGVLDSLFIKTGAVILRDTVVARGLIPGAGIRVAVLDNGFRLGHQAFDSLFARNAIVDQWDFVGDTSAAVSRTLGASHGAMVLSQIGGELPGVLRGLAPRARFLLYRTEDEAGESYVEEDYLAAALERAVDSGAQVISISLGYRYDFDSGANYPYSQLDGRTRPSSLAALGAARRGALVVVAIGNEGLSREGLPTVTAPSDADSIVAVGSLNAAGARCSYSGTGPSFDGRIKPEVSGPGCTMTVVNPSTPAGVWNQSGTSLSAPVVAGIGVLLRQLHPDSVGISSQRIRQALMSGAASASNPDNLTGRGLVRAAAAHQILLPGSLIGVLPWRDGRRARLPWANVKPSGARLWDMLGRSRPVQGGWSPEGDVLIETSGRMAPGAYILKLPPGPDPSAP